MDAAVAALLTRIERFDGVEKSEEGKNVNIKNNRSKNKPEKVRETDENYEKRYVINKEHVMRPSAKVDPIYYQKPFPEHFSESNDDKRFGSAFDILDQMCPNVENSHVKPWVGFPGTTIDKLLEDAKNLPQKIPLKEQYFEQIRDVLQFLYVAEKNNSIGDRIKNSYTNNKLDNNRILERDSLSLVIHESTSTSSPPIYKYRTFLEPLLRPVIIDSSAFDFSTELIVQVLIHFVSLGHRCIALFPEENHQSFEALKIFKLIQIPSENNELCWKEKVECFTKSVGGILVSDGLVMPKFKNKNDRVDLLWPDEEQWRYNTLKYYPPKCIDLPTMISQQLYLAEQSMFLSILLRSGLYSNIILWKIKSLFYLISTQSPSPSDILWKGFDISSFPLWSNTSPEQFWSNDCAPENRLIQKNWKMEAELLDDEDF